MSKVIPITSQAHFKSTLSSTTILVVDFYADWCGPCKQISPIFEQLATSETRPGKMTFCKVDVDAQRDVASTYGVSAMPTFLILRSPNTTVQTIRGANPSALRTAVLSASAAAGKAPPASSASFTGKGQTLGASASHPARTVRAPVVDVGALWASPAAFAQGRGWVSTVVRFVGLYVVSFLSLEPGAAAGGSGFAVQKAGGGQRVR